MATSSNMGLYDRDYTREGYKSQSHYPPQMRLGLPPISPMVKTLLLINVAVYFLQLLTGDALTLWFAVYPVGLGVLQLWRLVTYQ
ncbi:MAG: hypothetical protein KAY65_14955, partial [Planctomycetes bacterium]|nr:hypothetical protein [Planctomycetota bacterium]